MNQLLGKAIRFALAVHTEQVDKSGMPYAGHIMRVMASGKTIDEKIVGVLHDVIEDTEYTFDDLLSQGYPVYIVDGIMHYVVDHTPTLLYKEATYSISNEITHYLDDLIEDKKNKILEDALIIEKGKIVDYEIIEFQNRK